MKAHELIAERSHWLKDNFCKMNDLVIPTSLIKETDPALCQYCMAGAIIRAYGAKANEVANRLIEELPGFRPENEKLGVLDDLIYSFNDGNDHATVLAKLRELDL